MWAQRLSGPPFASAAEAVTSHLAVQAQEFAEVKWSLSERTGGLTDAELDDAFNRGDILRTHVLRPTWHLVAPQDIRWLLELTAPRVRRALRYYDRQIGLDDDRVLADAADVIVNSLADAGGPLLRTELAGALEEAGIEASGQRLTHIVMHAELDGLICNGPRRGKQHTYLLLSERAPEATSLDREEALARLVSRYFRSHGPATVRDCSWWSGLTMSDVKVGVAACGDDLGAETGEDGTAWYSGADAAPAGKPDGAHLIPTYDELVVAYKDQRMVYAAPPPEEGLGPRPILIDGRAVGSWTRTLGSNSATVDATLHAMVSRAGLRKLEEAVERFGGFLGLPVELRLERSVGA